MKRKWRWTSVISLSLLLVTLSWWLWPTSTEATGAPDYLPDGSHPRIWLTDERLNELRAKRDTNHPDWVALLQYCETHKNDTGYDVPYDPTHWQSTWNGTPVPLGTSGTGYRGSGYAVQMTSFALCYQMLKDTDPARGDEYARHAINVMHGLVNSFSVGEEPNGLGILRVGERVDGTTNVDEAAAIGNNRTNYKNGYSARTVGVAMPLAYDWLHEKLTPAERQKFYSVMFGWVDWYRGTRSDYYKGVLVNGQRYYEDGKGYAYEGVGDNFSSGFAEMAALTPLATFGDTADAQTYLDFYRNDYWGALIKPTLLDPLQNKGGDSGEGWNYGSGWPRIIESLYAYHTSTGEPVFSDFDWPKEFLQSYIHAIAPNLKNINSHGTWPANFLGALYPNLLVSPSFIVNEMYPDDTIGNVSQYILENGQFAFQSSQWETFLWKDDTIEAQSPNTLPLFYRSIGTGLVTMRSTWENIQDSIFASVQLGGKLGGGHENYDEGHIALQRGDDKLLFDDGYEDHPNAHNTIVFNGQFQHAANPPLSEPAIDRIHDQDSYFFVRGELSNAYRRQFKPSLANLFYRNVLFVRPNYFIIYDVTQSVPSQGNLKEWYTQYLADPTISEDTIEATVGQSRLSVKTLFPPGGSFAKTQPKNNWWRVKYTPAVTQEFDQFLHVLEAADANSEPVSSRLINGSGGRGAIIYDPAEDIVAMFTSSQTGVDMSHLSYNVETSTQSRHIITNLIPRQSYAVTIDTEELGQFTANEGGTIEFTHASAGSHTYSVASGEVESQSPPEISIPASHFSVKVGETLVIPVTVTDADGDDVLLQMTADETLSGAIFE